MKLGVKRLMRLFPRGIWAEGQGGRHEGQRGVESLRETDEMFLESASCFGANAFYWAKDERIGFKTINARAETIDTALLL